jgi:opacity protein-like surface antigen
MNRWILTLGLLALCASPASSSSFGLFATGIFTDEAGDEVGLGLLLEFDAGRHVDFQIRGSLFEDLESDADPDVYDIQAAPIDLGFNYDFRPNEKIRPYVGLGVTYWVLDFSTDTTPGTPGRGKDIDGENGAYAELGIEFAVHRTWHAFIEAVYRIAKAEVEGDDLGGPIDQDVKLNSAAVNVGAKISW